MAVVNLYLRITKEGKRTYTAVFTETERRAYTVRKQYAGPLPFCYFLRYEDPKTGKRIWEAATTSLKDSVIKLHERELDLATEKAYEPEPKQVAKQTLQQQRIAFLERKRLTKKRNGEGLDKETLSAYDYMTREFLDVIDVRFADQIKDTHVLRWMDALRERGLSHRTICNYWTSLITFLRFIGLGKEILSPAERPTPDDGDPESYKEDQIARFLQEAKKNPRDYYAFLFFLETGCRLREVVFAEWNNLNWETGVVQIHGKKDVKIDGKTFVAKTKTRKSRPVTVSPELLKELRVWRTMNPHTLMFPTESGKPNTKFLQCCKRIAHRVGLSCGKCKNCVAGTNECHMWKIKTFRSSSATWQLRSKIYDIPTISKQLGHADTAVTMRYLRSEDAEEVQKRKGAVFAGLRQKLDMLQSVCSEI